MCKNSYCGVWCGKGYELIGTIAGTPPAMTYECKSCLPIKVHVAKKCGCDNLYTVKFDYSGQLSPKSPEDIAMFMNGNQLHGVGIGENNIKTITFNGKCMTVQIASGNATTTVSGHYELRKCDCDC